MKKTALIIVPALLSIALTGCVSAPEAPTVMVLPGSGKTYETFQHDDVLCRNTAGRSLNGEVHSANNNGMTTAATGTAIGAAAGALIGSAGGPRGTVDGLAVGAASGLLLGSAVAGGGLGQTQSAMQDQYNVVYVQCMYAKGHKIPQAYAWDEPENTSDIPPDYHP
ncbi:TPA: glycine zipper family protein [Klebsiella variicola]|uniref:glycine zipper family protein n=1 Tax=Klebsiella variicola TaxID=244366 RepID=UPI000E3B788F|nr:glycine zipper family protein [Klebsiella variicola]HED1713919.1 glycine zipper family protein [Klebsiella variicola subsp. variicola]